MNTTLSQKMHLAPLGELTRDLDIEEWFRGGSVTSEYLGGQDLEIIIEGIEDDEAPGDYTAAINAFLSLTTEDRAGATPYVFENYRRFVDMVGEDEFDFSVASQEDIWRHVSLTAVHVARRYRRDREVYVQLTGNCDWEIEHGLQVVLRRGHILSRVSSQDGHLTTAEAYALPEEQNTIIYQG